MTGVLVWLYVLAQRSAQLALREAKLQAELLEKEIASHKATNLQLVESKNAADEANQAKSRYLSGVSHELRTPLNTIFGYAQLMENDASLDSKSRKVASVIKRSGQHLSDVIEGLLDISKIEARKFEIHNDTVPIQKLMLQLDDMFSHQARVKGVNFAVHNLESLPAYVKGDEKRLRQILLNLLSNAFKYTQQGSVVLDISYRSQVALFRVKDSGVGISREDQERVFEPFSRIKNPLMREVSGTGLGLAISSLLAELMGGRILLQSELGKGSVFTLQILLPRIISSPKEAKPDVRLSQEQVSKSVLVVDDEHSHRQLLDDLLTPYGLKVIQADSVADALEQAHANSVDLFILDVNLPDSSGWELLQSLRAEHYQQPVIMLSAEPYVSDEVNQLQSWFSAYLTKPLDVDRLLAQLEKLLDLSVLSDSEPQPEPSPTIESVAEQDLELLAAMCEYAKIGYLKGLIDSVARLEERYAGRGWYPRLVKLIEQCDFEAVIAELNKIGNCGDSGT